MNNKKGCLIGCGGIFALILVLIIVIATSGDSKKDVDYTKLDAENITIAITNVVNEETDEDKKRVFEIDVNKDNQVTAKLFADSVLNAESVVYDSSDILAELQKFQDVTRIELDWLGTMVDDKGQESIGTIVNIAFRKEVMDTINFENFAIDGYSKYADIYYVHPAWQF